MESVESPVPVRRSHLSCFFVLVSAYKLEALAHIAPSRKWVKCVRECAHFGMTISWYSYLFPHAWWWNLCFRFSKCRLAYLILIWEKFLMHTRGSCEVRNTTSRTLPHFKLRDSFSRTSHYRVVIPSTSVKRVSLSSSLPFSSYAFINQNYSSSYYFFPSCRTFWISRTRLRIRFPRERSPTSLLTPAAFSAIQLCHRG